MSEAERKFEACVVLDFMEKITTGSHFSLILPPYTMIYAFIFIMLMSNIFKPLVPIEILFKIDQVDLGQSTITSNFLS